MTAETVGRRPQPRPSEDAVKAANDVVNQIIVEQLQHELNLLEAVKAVLVVVGLVLMVVALLRGRFDAVSLLSILALLAVVRVAFAADKRRDALDGRIDA